MRKRFILVWFTLALAANIVACKKSSSATTIQGTWKSPEYDGPALTKLFIVGVARKQANRELYETAMAEAVRRQGADAEASYVAVGDSKRLTKSQGRAAIEAGNFDGIIFTHVLSVEDRLEYQEGKTTYVPTSNVDLYMMDYDQRYETINEPGYYKTKTTYNIETIVFDPATGKKLWWAVSETVQPKSVDQIIREVSDATAKRMKDEGVIR